MALLATRQLLAQIHVTLLSASLMKASELWTVAPALLSSHRNIFDRDLQSFAS